MSSGGGVKGKHVRSSLSFEVSSDLVARLYGRANSTWDRIVDMFKVQLQCGPSRDNSNCKDLITVRGDRAAVVGAKEYILALCDEPEAQREVRFPIEFHERLRGTNGERHLELERASWALVLFRDGVATVRGSAAACTSAVEIIEEFVRFFQGVDTDPSLYDCIPYQRVRAIMLSNAEQHGVATRKDSNVENLVTYATQVGWTEKQVRAATEMLGSAADVDMLLKYLMKEHPLDGGHDTSQPSQQAVGSLQSVGEASDSNQSCETSTDSQTGLRKIVIDGSNVAMSYSHGKFFACVALQKCVEHFQKLGHTSITCFVPRWRKETSRPEAPIEDQHILGELEQRNILVFTPSKRVHGKRITSYDDRYIVQLAYEKGGVIVSNDYYRDLVKENEEWRVTIEQRSLPYAWADGLFMPAPDPLGKDGPTLTEFLRFPTQDDSRSSNVVATTSKSKVLVATSSSSSSGGSVKPRSAKVCPFKRCTYGQSCSYRHPEREVETCDPQPTAVTRVPDDDMTVAISRGSYPAMSHNVPDADMMPAPQQLMSFLPSNSKPARRGMAQAPPPPPPPPQSMYGFGYDQAQQHSAQPDLIERGGMMQHPGVYDTRPYHSRDQHQHAAATYPRYDYDHYDQQQQQHYGHGHYYVPSSGQYGGMQQQQQQQHTAQFSLPTQGSHPLPPDFQPEGFPEPPDAPFPDWPAMPLSQHPAVPEPVYREPLPTGFPEPPSHSHFHTMADSGYSQPDPYSHPYGMHDQVAVPSHMSAYSGHHAQPQPPPPPPPPSAPQQMDVDALARKVAQSDSLVKDFQMAGVVQPQQREDLVKDLIHANAITQWEEAVAFTKMKLQSLRQQR